MEVFVRLQQTLLTQNSTKQFETRLFHSRQKLSGVLLNMLLFQLVKIKTVNFGNYLQCLLNNGADVNWTRNYSGGVENQSFFMVCCEYNCGANVSQILDAQNVNIKLTDSRNENALFYALRNKNTEDSYKIISSIIHKHPQLVDSLSYDQKTVLVKAIQLKQIRIIEFLLKNSVDLNIPSGSSRNSALQHCLITLNSDPQTMKNIILLLLNSGADPHQQNRKKQNSFDIAQKINFSLKEIMDLYHHSHTSQNKNNQGEKKQGSQFTVTKDDDSNGIFSDSEDEEETPVANIQQQIQSIYQEYQVEIQNAWEDIAYLYMELERMGTYRNLGIEIIGSYATGLWNTHSDINISLTNQNDHPIDINQTLKWLYSNINKFPNQFSIKQSFINLNSHFPNIKITLDSEHHCRKIDIVIFQKKNNGRKYANFMIRQLTANPFLQPLYYILHKLLKSFNLHLPSNNGLKTYAIFLMILQFSKLYQASSILDLFINFINYYANCFPYPEYISESGQTTMQLNIMDPLNPKNNIGGRKTDVEKLYSMFKIVDCALKLGEDGGFCDGGFQYILGLANCMQ